MTPDPELAALTITERVILSLALEPHSTSRDLSMDTGFNVGTVCSVLKPMEIAGVARFNVTRPRGRGRPARCWTLTDRDKTLRRYELDFYFRRMSA